MSMNEDIRRFPVYALSQQGLVPIEIYSTEDYNHITHQLHHYIRQGAYKGNEQWYKTRGIEQKLILLPCYIHEQVHQQAIKNLTDEEFRRKFNINRYDLIFNRNKWREGYYD